MKKKGQPARAGDVISYIFCVGEDGQSSKTGQADRARHPDEIRKAETTNKIGRYQGMSLLFLHVSDISCVDFEHYLSQQILPPIERLCEPLQGTDRSRLAECLGLDPSKYRSSSGDGGDGEEERIFGTLDSRLSDEVKFKDMQPLVVSCTGCDGQIAFEPVNNREVSNCFFVGS